MNLKDRLLSYGFRMETQKASYMCVATGSVAEAEDFICEISGEELEAEELWDSYLSQGIFVEVVQKDGEWVEVK